MESDANAVRLMNCHKSKGLTGQIVIICDRSKNEKPKYGGFRKGSKYYASVCYRASNRSTTTHIPSYGYDYDTLINAGNEEKAEAVRLEYVAATRAEHALIIMPALIEEAWFTDPVYEYDSLPDINGWMKIQKTNTIPTDLINNAYTTGSSIRLSDLSAEIIKVNSQLKACQQISISPSDLESGEQTGYGTDDKDIPGYAYEDRPGSAIFGTVMHRTFELLVERRSLITDENSKEEQIKKAINQAIIESYDDIVTPETDNRSRYFNFLHDTLTLNGYCDRILALVNGADEVYTEFGFSFLVPDEERDWFMITFKPYLDAKKIVIPDGAPIWINGQADLVVKNGDNITVYDYKSDKRNGKPIADFIDALGKKYAGQLELYKYAVRKAFDVTPADVNVGRDELLHLYKNI